MVSVKEIIEKLKQVKDPELGFDVVSLGEIDRVEIDEKGKKIIIHFLPTTPLCPYLPYLFDEIYVKLKKNYPEYEVEFELVTDKQWSLERVSEEIREKLGISE